MKYRKKPVVIEAHQWNELGNIPIGFYEQVIDAHKVNHTGVIQRKPDYIVEGICNKSKSILRSTPVKAIKTLEGWQEVSFGDWIIKGIKGEFYPCKPDIFEATYEKVEE